MRDNHNRLWATIGVTVLVFALGLVQHVAAGSSERTTFLTFNRAVELPGASLPAGTYVFELVDPVGGSGVVRVASQDRRTTHFLGFTNRTERPRGLHLDASVSFGESAAGAPPRITTWWPIGENTGHQFIYRDR